MKQITRRNFLKGTVAGAASLAFSTLIYEESLGGVLAAEETQSSGISLDVSDYMDQWIYIDEAVVTSQGSVVLDEDGNPQTQAVTPCYALQGLVYCSNPADASVQVMDIYVPAVYMNAVDNGDDTYTCTVNTEAVFTNGDVTYTAQTAPIIYQNGINGYSEGAPASVAGARKGGPGTNEDNLLSGYIFVGVGCRGKDSEVDGTAPACIVDLKAGVRYLKANSDVLPGDTNKIFAAGSSAGGSVTALLAASGNSSLYDPYLEEIGAIMDATDDICGALVFCPIADLGIGDAAFEYLHDGETTLKVGWGDVEPTDMTEFQTAMHEALVDSYEEYLGTLGMDADEYYAAFLDQINASIANYVELYVEDTDAFAEENPALTYEDGTFRVADVTTFVSTYMSRSKTVPAFDTLDKSSNEAGLFDGEHFSENVLSLLESLADEYEEAAEAVDEYAAEITEERLLEVKLMSASTFLTGEEESTIAPYWRFRNGTLDGDLGSIAAFTMKKILDANGYDTDYDLIWGYGHTMADYSFEDIQTYIDAICAE